MPWPWKFRNRQATTAPPSPPGRPLRTLVMLGGFLGLLLLAQSPILGASTQVETIDPYKVEAAFLRNFAHYVTWPSEAFGDAATPWRICVLGSDPFSEILETTLQGRTEQGRSFQVFRADSLNDLPPCQILYVALADSDRRRAVLAQLRDKPVLTVGEAASFLREGGIIRLQQRKTVEMSVNLDQARAAALKIQTRMLEVTAEVVENGVTRKTR